MRLTGRPIPTKVRLTHLVAPIVCTFVFFPVVTFSVVFLCSLMDNDANHLNEKYSLWFSVTYDAAFHYGFVSLVALPVAPFAWLLAYFAVRLGWHGWVHVVGGTIVVAPIAFFVIAKMIQGDSIVSVHAGLASLVLAIALIFAIPYGITARMMLQWFNPELYE